MYLEKPLQFSYKIGSGGVEECNASLLQLYAWRVKCRERAKAIKMRVTRLLSISHIVQFLGWKEKREAVFINIPTIPFPLSVNLCGKKEKSFRASPPCVITTVCPVKTSKEFSVLSSLQFFGLLSNFKKKVKKNFLNFKGFFSKWNFWF